MAEYINYNETSIANLPVAEDINLNDYIIVQPQDFNNKTCILQFKNLVFGMENVSFANTITQNSANIVQLSSDIKNCNDLVAGVDERINEVEESLKNDITAVENIVNEVNSKITDINTSTTIGAIDGSRIIEKTITKDKLADDVIPSVTPFTPNLDNIPPHCFPDYDITALTPPTNPVPVSKNTNIDLYTAPKHGWIYIHTNKSGKFTIGSSNIGTITANNSIFIPIKNGNTVTAYMDEAASVTVYFYSIADDGKNQ